MICDKVGLSEYISSLKEGINTKIGERGVKISGAQKQRIAIARTILNDSDIIVSTATEYGAKLIENLPVKTSSEKMNKEAMLKFVDDNKITKVIDTSHPYAFEVSKNAMEVAEEKKIQYFRFEREKVDILPKKYKNFEEKGKAFKTLVKKYGK